MIPTYIAPTSTYLHYIQTDHFVSTTYWLLHSTEGRGIVRQMLLKGPECWTHILLQMQVSV